MTWIVREGRTTRYLYICRQEGQTISKVAEIDLWSGTNADASLIAAAPRLLAALKKYADVGERPTLDDLMEARAAVIAAETPFVHEYKRSVSAE